MASLATSSIIFNLGLLASLAPCLFPVLPSYTAYITQTSRTNNSIFKGFISSVLVVLGIMTVFITLGLITSIITSEFLDFFSDNYRKFSFLQGILLIIVGGILIFRISIGFNRLTELSGSSQELMQNFKNPYLVSYFIGLFFALLAAPCALIYFLTLFLIVAGETISNTIFYMIIFSLGASFPFTLVGTIFPLIKNKFEGFGDSFKSSVLSKRANDLNTILPRIVGLLIIIVGIILINDSQLIQRSL
ncbi:MAG: cytochrome c biogenesis CcdA family protein [Candidatus Hodarchaeales archaeon]|jgi:cytochrome c-type biogenesis protein